MCSSMSGKRQFKKTKVSCTAPFELQLAVETWGSYQVLPRESTLRVGRLVAMRAVSMQSAKITKSQISLYMENLWVNTGFNVPSVTYKAPPYE